MHAYLLSLSPLLSVSGARNLGLLGFLLAVFSVVVPLVVMIRQGALGAMLNRVRANVRKLLLLLLVGVSALVFVQLLSLPFLLSGSATVLAAAAGGLAFTVSVLWAAVLAGAYYLVSRDLFTGEPSEAAIPILTDVVAREPGDSVEPQLSGNGLHTLSEHAGGEMAVGTGLHGDNQGAARVLQAALDHQVVPEPKVLNGIPH